MRQVPVIAVGQEEHRQGRHHPADGAASGLQHQQQAQRAQGKVGGSLDAGPVPQRFPVGPEIREPPVKQRLRHQDDVTASRNTGGGQGQIRQACDPTVPPALTSRDAEKAKHQPQHDKQGQLGLRPQPGEVDLGQGIEAQDRTQDGDQPPANGLEHEPTFLVWNHPVSSCMRLGKKSCPRRTTKTHEARCRGEPKPFRLPLFTLHSPGAAPGSGWQGWVGSRSPGGFHRTRRLRDETGSRYRGRRPE